jgi:SSS family solute:Na+ symporter
MLWHLGGISLLLNAVPPDKLSFPLSSKFGAADFISYLLLIGLTYVVGPDLYARLFCAKDVRTAKVSTLWAAGLIIPFAFCVTLIGMGALVLFPQISPEQAFPAIITGVLPSFAAGFVLAALLSAVMSSASATLWSASTILTVNIMGQGANNKKTENEAKSVSISRWGILFVGLASLGLAMVLNGVINALLFAYTIYSCGVILPVIAGFYKDKLKVTSTAALVAIIGGGTAGLASKIWNIRYLDLGALFLNLFLLLAVSLIENRIRARRVINHHGLHLK